MRTIPTPEVMTASRRRFLGVAATTITVAQAGARSVKAQGNSASSAFAALRQVDAGLLNVGYAEAGPAGGQPVLLLHGWLYDIYSYVEVAPMLASAGYRVIVPYLRGYGTTRFLSDGTMRNGQQSVVAVDAIALMDALKIKSAIVAGFDWGARTADIMAAVWPERCKGLVSVSGYLIGSPEANRAPLPPAGELAWWYQFYFATERGRAGYDKYRRDFANLIWKRPRPGGNSAARRSTGPPPRSTIRIMSRSLSIITAGASASRMARRNMTTWKSGWRRRPSSACQQSRSKAMRTLHRTGLPHPMPASFRADISTGTSLAVSVTTYRRKRRRRLRRP